MQATVWAHPPDLFTTDHVSIRIHRNNNQTDDIRTKDRYNDNNNIAFYPESAFSVTLNVVVMLPKSSEKDVKACYFYKQYK